MKILWKHSKLNYNLADRNPISWCNRLDWCPSKVGQMHWENTFHTTFAISLCVVTTKLITSSSLHISVITMRGHSGTMGPRIHYVTWISRLDRTSCRAAKTPKKALHVWSLHRNGKLCKICVTEIKSLITDSLLVGPGVHIVSLMLDFLRRVKSRSHSLLLLLPFLTHTVCPIGWSFC